MLIGIAHHHLSNKNLKITGVQIKISAVLRNLDTELVQRHGKSVKIDYTNGTIKCRIFLKIKNRHHKLSIT